MLNSEKTEVILLGPEHLRYLLSGDVVSVDVEHHCKETRRYL